MTLPQRQRALSTGLAMLLACAVLLPLLGHRQLTDWDEGIYAEVSREMLGGSWLAPHWNGRLWLEKPPLMLWVSAFFFKCFGVSAFWARAGSALSGVAVMALLHNWLLRVNDTATAWVATIVLLATPGFLHICRTGEMDALLSLGSLLALIGLAQVDQRDPWGWYLFWVGLAVASMTKGAASVVLPITCLVLSLIGRYDLKYFGKHFLGAALLFLALVLPWHIAMYSLFGSRFIEEYLGFHVIVRATQQIEGHVTPWWYYGKVLLSYAVPFILILPLTVSVAFRTRGMRAWAVFCIVVVIFFTFIQTRLPHYIAPLYPALAVLVSTWLVERWRTLQQTARGRGVWIGAGAAALWAGSLLVTGGLRSSLHRGLPVVGGPNRRESLALAQVAATDPTPGPLLVWRDGSPASIAGEVFYAHRDVEQVQPEPAPAGPPRNRYAEERQALADAVAKAPRLLLLDNRLLDSIPSGYQFTPVRSAKTVTLGIIGRTPWDTSTY